MPCVGFEKMGPEVVAANGVRVIDQVAVTVPLDPWLSLQAAAGYSCLSVRNLRGWLGHPERPLPCYRVGGKILLRRSELDRWLSAFRRVGKEDVDTLVDRILKDIQTESNHELGGQTPQGREAKRQLRSATKRVAPGLQNGAE